MIVPVTGKPENGTDQNMVESCRNLGVQLSRGVFGQAKVYHGMARSKFRGLLKVEIQFLLTATALNLKKMVKVLDIDKLKSELSRKISGIIETGKNILRNLIKELAVQPS